MVKSCLCLLYTSRIADINLYTPAEEPYSGTPATLFESLRQLQFQEVEAFPFVAYPRPRSYNVETIDKEELPYEDLYAMEVDTAYHSVFTPEVLQGSDVYKRQGGEPAPARRYHPRHGKPLSLIHIYQE